MMGKVVDLLNNGELPYLGVTCQWEGYEKIQNLNLTSLFLRISTGAFSMSSS
jgi:hypothetical protein